MKTTIRTIEYTVEKRESVVVKPGPANIHAFCGVCGSESEMSTSVSIGKNFALDPRDIFGLIADESVGYCELPNGSFLVCLNCIQALP